MKDQEWLAARFEDNRGHLRAVAYRMLGSASAAEDAVQEAWLRLTRSDADQVENLGGWLTTVVARICLDMLRSRNSRGEESLEEQVAEPVAPKTGAADPEQEAVLADSVGLALLVVLDRLSPAERLAFVLHDMFAVSFEEIAAITGRTTTAARQLASRARRRVQGADVHKVKRVQEREVVNAFLTALRSGDFEGLIAVLDPNVVVHIDEASGQPGGSREIRGAENWARGAIAFRQMARFVEPMLVDGSVGLAFAPGGKLERVLRFAITNGKIVDAEIIGEPSRLQEMELAVLED